MYKPKRNKNRYQHHQGEDKLDCSVSSHGEYEQCPKPKSILRRRSSSSSSSSASSQYCVRFPSADDSSLVTAVHFRLRTHVLDKHKLYYSIDDIRRFKREKKSEKEQMIMLSEEEKMMDDMDTDSRRKQELDVLLDSCSITISRESENNHKYRHDNSFWRSKVRRRENTTTMTPDPPGASDYDSFSSVLTLNDTYEQSGKSTPRSPSVSSPTTVIPTVNDTSIGLPKSGIFTSALDKTREAVSILNGPTSAKYHDGCDQNRATAHFIDTLYLF